MHKKDLLTLACFGKIGPRGYEKIIVHSHSLARGNPDLFQEEEKNGSRDVARDDNTGEVELNALSSQDLIKAGIKSEIAQEFIQFKDRFDSDAELEKLDRFGITMISREDSAYPLLLHETHDAPYLLFVKGSVDGLQKSSLGVVGSRKHTHYGVQIIDRIVMPLAERGITIVSGLALGIDGLAHMAALKAGSQTVAIIGCGLDAIYPSEHTSLAREIVENGGAIVSEYPLGTAPLKQHFPARNRIIAGVSQGVLVVECDIKSGAMITAHHALEENREVYAVPGPITSISSAGPNSLLRMGAHVITCADDLLSYYGVEQAKGKAKNAPSAFAGSLPPHERLVFDILSHEPKHVDGLGEQLAITVQELNSALLFLEMKGLVQNVGAAQYIRR